MTTNLRGLWPCWNEYGLLVRYVRAQKAHIVCDADGHEQWRVTATGGYPQWFDAQTVVWAHGGVIHRAQDGQERDPLAKYAGRVSARNSRWAIRHVLKRQIRDDAGRVWPAQGGGHLLAVDGASILWDADRMIYRRENGIVTAIMLPKLPLALSCRQGTAVVTCRNKTVWGWRDDGANPLNIRPKEQYACMVWVDKPWVASCDAGTVYLRPWTGAPVVTVPSVKDVAALDVVAVGGRFHVVTADAKGHVKIAHVEVPA